MDPEAPDLVGRTSARLTALGVSRVDRLEALHLLAILDASADSWDLVRRPLDDLADEFELDPASVLRSLDHLVAAGAVERQGPALRFIDREKGGVGGLALAEFLDDVRSVHAARGHRIARRQVRAVAAAVAAAAAVAVVTLAPSTLAPPAPVAAGRDNTTALGPVSTSAPSRGSPATTRVRTPITDDTTSRTEQEAPAPPIPTALAAAACPDGGPVLSVVDGTVYVANTARADLRVVSIAVAGTPLDVDVAVPTGGTVAVERLLTVEDVTIGDWQWVDPELERGCPS